MKAMICKMEKGFEPKFFDCDTLDDLLDAIDECGYPPMQFTINDDRDDNARLGIEIFDDTPELFVAGRQGWTMKDEIKFRKR